MAMADSTTPDSATFPDIAGLRYEDAREELIAIVARLEAGQVPLEESMQLWRRGEALAAHCAQWLDGAQAEIERATRPPARAAAPAAEPAAHADDDIFDDEQ
jgi:exodeoxyribonuclease VII small subunit